MAKLKWKPLIILAIALLCASEAWADDDASAPTFSRDIMPVLQKHCQECHRPGQIAPMSFMSYDDVRPWAKAIREQIESRVMPPWPAAPPDSGEVKFANDRSMTDDEIRLVSLWVESGAPKGEEKDLPPPAKFYEGWMLGEPEMVMGMETPYEFSGEGPDDYRCFVFDPKFEESRWVTAVEIQPGNRTTNHHIVMYVDKSGKIAPHKDAEDPAPGYECFGSPGFQATQLAGWGPGISAKQYPENTGHLIPKGGKIVMQMHYHRTGKPESDQTRFGLHFAKGPIARGLRDGLIMNLEIDIPAGEANYVDRAQSKVMYDMTIHSVAPHMHLLGKSARMWATFPDGRELTLVNVPRWDFNWQTEYIFAEPVKVPRGSTLNIECSFDNSAENPNQEVNPPRRVRFGEQTTDEMLVGVAFHTKDSENLAGAN